MDKRLDDGSWGNLATARSLDQRAESMDLGAAAFVDFHPEEFVNDRT